MCPDTANAVSLEIGDTLARLPAAEYRAIIGIPKPRFLPWAVAYGLICVLRGGMLATSEPVQPQP